MPDHPELDLLEALMEVSSEDEDDDHKIVLRYERERKKKERNKRQKAEIDLSAPYQAPKEMKLKRYVPSVTIEQLVDQVRTKQTKIAEKKDETDLHKTAIKKPKAKTEETEVI